MPKSKKAPAKDTDGRAPAGSATTSSSKATSGSKTVLSSPKAGVSAPKAGVATSSKGGLSGAKVAVAGAKGAGSSAKAASPASKAVHAQAAGASHVSKAARRAANVERAARRAAEAARVKAAAASAAYDAAEAREPRKYPKGGPSKADLKRYREKLLDMRRALLSSSKELAAEALKSSGQDFSVDHMADHGSDNYEQDFSLKLLEGESVQLTDIREALMKIDGKLDPPFGVCEACADGEQKLCETCPWIPPSRLDVLPHARLCVQTKEIEERRRV